MKNIFIVRNMGMIKWKDASLKMHNFVQKSKNLEIICDEIWLLEHYPVFTQGQSNKEKINNINNIPVLQSDRGGNITYHGPGQQVCYILLNLKKRKLQIKHLIFIIEQSVINTLFYFKILSHRKKNCPGVYIKNKKICSLGLKIKDGYSLHGFSLNINMDLSPFSFINPCGFYGLKMTQMSDFIPGITLNQVSSKLIYQFAKLLNLSRINYY